MVRLTATDVARSFSAVMNRVGAGEEIEIVRNGVPIAQLQPPTSRQTVSAARWRDMVASAPPLDDDFGRELAEARASIASPVSAWPS